MLPENTKIDILSRFNDGKTAKEISISMNIKYATVHNIIKPRYTKKNTSVGRPRKVNQKEIKVINECVKRLKRNGSTVTSTKILKGTRLNMSPSTMQRSLKFCKYRYTKIKQGILLSNESKQKRLDVFEKWIAEGICFKNIIFSDEKRFCLDGPDNFYTWTKDASIEKREKRHTGGGGIMIHGLIGSDGYFRVVPVIGSLNAQNYKTILIAALNDLKCRYSDFIWMHDNAPAHKSRLINVFLEEENIKVLEWPPRSPDLNIIENVWSILSAKVYENRQFSKIGDLQKSIEEQVKIINESLKDSITNLYNSLPKRIISCIQKNGDIV